MDPQVKNKIGLEAEFLLRKNGELVFPHEYGFDTDDYLILGEIRCEPGETSSKTVTNFLEKWYEVLEKAKEKNLEIDISGIAKIKPDFKRKILQEMGEKYFSDIKNIYGTEILELTDDTFNEKGNLIFSKISTGLHIHFSSEKYLDVVHRGNKYAYQQVNIPINSGENLPKMEMEVFLRKECNHEDTFTHTLSISRITKPVVFYFIKQLDNYLLPEYLEGELLHLKYRKPGYYERKYYGFEYRSLPFTQKILENILEITKFGFKLLEELDF